VSDAPLLEVERLSKTFRVRPGRGHAGDIVAVQDLNFTVPHGGSLAIVGESGSGKTTTARMLIGLEVPSAGEIRLDGILLRGSPTRAQRRARARQIQIVFQNPYLSLDPRQSAAEAVDEVVRFQSGTATAASRSRALEILDWVGLGPSETRARPRELSGGQCQRVAIARALAAEPRLLVLDEAVSALDVSVQAQILNLLGDLRRRTGVAYLFISHDLGVVRQVADEVVVMYRGRAVERGRVDDVLDRPAHPYTQKLVSSIPRPGVVIPATPAAGDDPEYGCRFRRRCPLAFGRCIEEPPLIVVAGDHDARCWLLDPRATSTHDRIQETGLVEVQL
jgi:peptide/nickel transport system ATP-binding protein